MATIRNNIGLQYYDHFARLPIKKLISNYSNIELKVVEDARQTVTTTLEEYGFTRQDNMFVKRGIPCRLALGLSPGQRDLTVSITPHLQKGKIKTVETDTPEFGFIRKVIVHYQSPVTMPQARTICDRVKAQTVAAYIALEHAFLANAEDLHRSVFRKLYGVLRAHLAIRNKSHLFGRIWFFVAKPNLGLFYFDNEVLGRVIDYYKNNQNQSISPLEATVWIMSDPIPFEKTLSRESLRQRRPLVLAWSEARFIRDAPKAFQAAVLLYDYEKYTAYACCQTRGHYLSITFPTNIANQVLPELSTLSASLKLHFRDAIPQWSPLIEEMRKLSQAVDQFGVAKAIAAALRKATSELGTVLIQHSDLSRPPDQPIL